MQAGQAWMLRSRHARPSCCPSIARHTYDPLSRADFGLDPCSCEAESMLAGGGGVCGDARHAGAHGGQGRPARHRPLVPRPPLPRPPPPPQVCPSVNCIS